MLTTKIQDAFEYAAIAHAGQCRKGTQIPYLSHLMGVASLAMEDGQPDEAAAIVQAHEALAASPVGREVLARAALVGGRTDEARRLYQALGASSLEALVFLARDAYGEARWDDAEKHVAALLDVMPDNLVLRRSLSRVRQHP